MTCTPVYFKKTSQLNFSEHLKINQAKFSVLHQARRENPRRQQLADLKRGKIGTVDRRRESRVVDQHLSQLRSALGIHAASQAPHEGVKQPPDGEPAQNVL